MSNILWVIYSSEDTSRNFPAEVPADANATFLDWSQGNNSNYLGPPPSIFPTICCTVMASGLTSPNMVGLIINPANWAAASTIVNAFDNQQELQNISVWGSYESGSVITTPLVSLFNNSILLQQNNLNPIAQQMLPLMTSILSNPTLGPSYWQSLINNPPAWLDVNATIFVQNTAQLYNFPTLPQAVQVPNPQPSQEI